MNSKQLKLGSLLSYAQMALNVMIGLIYTPIMLRCLGQSEYGLYNTVASTISMLSILNLGFSSSYVRYFAKHKNNGDMDSINRLNGLFLMVFSVLGLVALVCGTYLTLNLNIIFRDGLTTSEYDIARILMFLLTINLAISFPMNVFTCIISANERYVFLKIVALIKNVFSPLIMMPLLLMGYRSVAMVTVTLVMSLIADALYIYYVFVVLKNKMVFRHFEKGILKSLVVYTSFIAINLLVDQINWSLGKVLLGRFCGTSAVAIYSIGFSLYMYYQTFSSSISSVFAPRIHGIVNSKEDESIRFRKLTDLFIRVGRIQFIILSLVCSGVILFGKYFIAFWAGKGYEHSYYVALLLILPATIPLIQNLGIEVQRALNKHKFRSFAYLFMAIINLTISIYFCQLYGAVGAAMGTAISLVIANGIVMNVYYHKKCGLDIMLFWKNILNICKGLIFPIVVGSFFSEFINLYAKSGLLFGIILYCVLFAGSMWFFGMNYAEKELIIGPLRRVVHRK